MRIGFMVTLLIGFAVMGLGACGGGGGGGPTTPSTGNGPSIESSAPSGFTFNPWPRDTVSLVGAGSRAANRITDISSDSLGGWNVSYVVAGRAGTIHLSSGDESSPNSTSRTLETCTLS